MFVEDGEISFRSFVQDTSNFDDAIKNHKLSIAQQNKNFYSKD